MKRFYLLQLLFLPIGGAIAFALAGIAHSISYMIGTAFITLDVALIQYVWKRIFSKKSVAWTVLVIVFKYTVLALLLYDVATMQKLPLGSFCLNIGTFILSVLVLAVHHNNEI